MQGVSQVADAQLLCGLESSTVRLSARQGSFHQRRHDTAHWSWRHQQGLPITGQLASVFLLIHYSLFYCLLTCVSASSSAVVCWLVVHRLTSYTPDTQYNRGKCNKTRVWEIKNSTHKSGTLQRSFMRVVWLSCLMTVVLTKVRPMHYTQMKTVYFLTHIHLHCSCEQHKVGE